MADNILGSPRPTCGEDDKQKETNSTKEERYSTIFQVISSFS